MCWWIVATPIALASLGLDQRTDSPFHEMRPSVGWIAPDRILINVDLPAPFAPKRPCTWPGAMSRSTPRRATVPFGNLLATPSSRASTSPVLAVMIALPLVAVDLTTLAGSRPASPW